MENGGWVVSLLAHGGQYTRARKSHKSRSAVKKAATEEGEPPNGDDEDEEGEGGRDRGWSVNSSIRLSVHHLSTLNPHHCDFLHTCFYKAPLPTTMCSQSSVLYVYVEWWWLRAS